MALGDPTRRQVLARVAECPRSVAEIASGLPVSRPAVSQHLRVLAEANLVAARKEGRRRVYRVQPDGLRRMQRELERFWSQALENLKSIAEQGEEGPK
jgi:DNA-binding transcriptional ArsR family regulator